MHLMIKVPDARSRRGLKEMVAFRLSSAAPIVR